MLRNYSRFKKYNYCSQIGGSESIRDIQEARNIDADAFEFQIVESIFSISKIMQALQKTYYDDLSELSSKYIFLNISNNSSLDLLNELKNFKIPDFLKNENIIINFDRRSLVKSIYKLKDNDFEVKEYEDEVNKLISYYIKKIHRNHFLISISGGITYESLIKLLNMKITFHYIKTGLFSVKIYNEDKIKIKNTLFSYQSLETKLINILSSSITNKTNYLENRKKHLTKYLVDLLN
tara:strand:+ start:351 stop:1058 length:708 start_codon:yes stop_codon:yes gene_type:complete